MAPRYIPESEFIAYTEGVLHEVQRAIARSGLTISEIAKGTRMKWSTVYNASQGVAVRIESACRIIYFLQRQKENENSGESSFGAPDPARFGSPLL